MLPFTIAGFLLLLIFPRWIVLYLMVGAMLVVVTFLEGGPSVEMMMGAFGTAAGNATILFLGGVFIIIARQKKTQASAEGPQAEESNPALTGAGATTSPSPDAKD
ncbi:hypothetical protein [Terricaulis silvestris]|uniref:Uncharacterized protein n=1 Tax=Terricaulis silvestris TaxID=2686094 RepID=A0A6I6MK44_9CAUL|nr:hypothetical protein [Terricaulis silvestris]QGZ93476.1 hypothetical protein DSM104635_00286 [Terricaulis silvestris]